MGENRPLYDGLEKNLKQQYNPTGEDIKRWEKKWKKFHKSLPNKMVFADEFTLYKQGDNTYLPYQPQRKRWYWPF